MVAAMREIKMTGSLRLMKRVTCLMLCAALLGAAATSCRRYTPIHRDVADPPRPIAAEPVPERVVTISGEALALPMNALPPAAMSGERVGEADLEALARTPGAQMLMRPKMRVTENTSGRFTLGTEGSNAKISLELTPRIQPDGRIALGAHIEAKGNDGVTDAISRDRLFLANTGDYGVFGPVRMDQRNVYVLLKGSVEQ